VRDGRVTESPYRGDIHYKTRLTTADVLEIRRRIAAGDRVSVIARDYGVCSSTVSLIHLRRNWRHV